MLAVYILAAAIFVFVIAAAAVGWETHRLDEASPQTVFDPDEAVEWVANRLPFEITAVLSHDDVRRILDWNLEYFRSKGVSGNGSSHTMDSAVVVGGSETVAYVLDRAAAEGATYTAGQIHAILDAQLSYFEAIGAVGPQAPPDEL